MATSAATAKQGGFRHGEVFESNLRLGREFSHQTNGGQRSYENIGEDRQHRRLNVGSPGLDGSAPDRAVVASLASDPNVWNVVMENPAVCRFFQSQTSLNLYDHVNTESGRIYSYELDVNENFVAVSDSGVVETTEKVGKLSTFSTEGDETLEKMEATVESDSGSMFLDFMGFLQNLKLTVTELVSSVSSFLQNIFPSPDSSKEAIGPDSAYGKLGERIPIPYGGG
ncbi:uncharacterized protein LOC106780571 [Vigna radiata var. radiata]|uniref:Uncharacterized protein LOC106780571 n=1 Tax=Vigna radiata var. radiata TaxID=3916 RepID=A0A3Q0ERB3_VIGRR|nr:uncharacterized protein LOC106780571 [Vigna radiata var. radiata]